MRIGPYRATYTKLFGARALTTILGPVLLLKCSVLYHLHILNMPHHSENSTRGEVLYTEA
jgi:hypothetical protein